MSRLLATGLVIASAAVAGAAIELYALTRPAEAASVAAVAAPAPAAVAHQDVPPSAVPAAPPPVTHAPAPSSANAAAHAERATWFARIRDAHVGHEAWDDAGLALLQQLGGDEAAVSDEGCYMAGCIAELTFASLGAYRDAIDAVAGMPAYTSWTGAKHITAPEQLPGGGVVVAVVLERPD